MKGTGGVTRKAGFTVKHNFQNLNNSKIFFASNSVRDYQCHIHHGAWNIESEESNGRTPSWARSWFHPCCWLSDSRRRTNGSSHQHYYTWGKALMMIFCVKPEVTAWEVGIDGMFWHQQSHLVRGFPFQGIKFHARQDCITFSFLCIKKMLLCSVDMAQQLSTCLAFVKPWVWSIPSACTSICVYMYVCNFSFNINFVYFITIISRNLVNSVPIGFFKSDWFHSAGAFKSADFFSWLFFQTTQEFLFLIR